MSAAEKLQEFKENSLRPIDILDIEKFLKISQLQSMKSLICNRKITFSRRIQNCCEILSDRIYINPRYSLDECLLFVVTKLRKQSIYNTIDIFKLSIDEYVFYRRALEADSLAYLSKVLWEIVLSNIDKDIILLFNTNKTIREMYETYKLYSSSSFRNINNGKSFFEAFNLWFIYNVDHIDNQAVNLLLSIYFKKIIHNPDSKFEFLHKFKINNISYMNSSFIKNRDPLCFDVRSRKNANTLWFLKFEQTVEDAEKELKEFENADKKLLEKTLKCDIIDFNEYRVRRNLL